MTPETVDAWLDSPIVTYLKLRNPEIGLVDLLVEHHKVQCKLEELFPGLSFNEIFAACIDPLVGEDRGRIGAHLRELGYGKEMIDLVAPPNGLSDPEVRIVLARKVQFRGYDKQAEIADAVLAEDISHGEVMQRFGVGSTQATVIRTMTRPLAADRAEIAARAIDTDVFWADLAEEAGVSASSIAYWARALRYQRERGLVSA